MEGHHKSIITKKTFLYSVLLAASFSSFTEAKTITPGVHHFKMERLSVLVSENMEEEYYGYIYNSEGKLLGNVTIRNRTTGKTTKSFDDGTYVIKANKGDVLEFSSETYKTQTITLGTKLDNNIYLVFSEKNIDEVVLIGYGTQNRKQVSTAITKIDGDKISKNTQSGVSFDKNLGGLVKGVMVTQGSGTLGSGADINVRGITSPFSGSNNNPLFVIDGVAIQGNSMNDLNPLSSINPDDIESVDLLKDAAATSIYGSRGANGVFIIKTKRGKKYEPLQINFSTKLILSQPINKLDYLNADEYKNYYRTAIKNSIEMMNKYPQFSPSLNSFLYYYKDFGADVNIFDYTKTKYNPALENYGNANTNWANEVYRKAALTNEYGLSAAGGSSNTAYFLSLRHINQEGLLRNDNSKQYNARLDLSLIASPKLILGGAINFNKILNNSGINDMNGNLNSGILNARPDVSPYDSKGNITFYPLFFMTMANPIGITTKNINVSDRTNLTGNFFAEYEIIKNLKIKTSLSSSFFDADASNFTPYKYSSIGYSNFASPSSTLNTYKSKSNSIIADFTANYRKTIDKNQFEFLLGYTWNKDQMKYENFQYRGFPDDKNLITPEYAENVISKDAPKLDPIYLISYFGRVNYDYNKKYNLTLGLRKDDSSKFGPDFRDAVFYSIASSWNVQNEDFLKNNKYINQLKFRAGYGTTGSTNVPNYSYKNIFTINGYYNGQLAMGQNTVLPNTAIGWEKTKELNIGNDFGFFGNRLKGSIDWYNRTTDGAIMQVPFAVETGASSYTANFAKINNKGFEVDLSAELIKRNDLSFEIFGNISKNVVKLLEFNRNGINPEYLNNYGYEVGREPNYIIGYEVEGIYQNVDEINALNAKAPGNLYDLRELMPGDYKIKDQNGDGKIDGKDRVYLGSSLPDFYGGFGSSLRYKNFELSSQFNFVTGTEAFRPNAMMQVFPYNVERQYNVENRWSPTNTSAPYAALVIGSTNNARRTNKDVFDSSYLRLKTLQLSYNLPVEKINSPKINSIRLFVTGYNLFTWTKFPGLDPESVSGGLANVTSNSNSDPYPLSKSFTFGLNVNF